MSEEKGTEGIEQAKAALRRARADRSKVESLRPEVTHLAAKAARVVRENGFSDLAFNLAYENAGKMP